MRISFGFIFLVILLMSCNKEEDGSIVGTYKMTFMSQSNCDDSSENFELDFGNDECTTALGIEFCQSGTFNLSADGDFTSTVKITSPVATSDVADLNGRGTYVANGSVATLCFPNCADFTVDGNSLTLNQTGDDCNRSFVLTKI